MLTCCKLHCAIPTYEIDRPTYAPSIIYSMGAKHIFHEWKIKYTEIQIGPVSKFQQPLFYILSVFDPQRSEIKPTGIIEHSALNLGTGFDLRVLLVLMHPNLKIESDPLFKLDLLAPFFL